jgi:C-terminal processing protease CtpA/Prc
MLIEVGPAIADGTAHQKRKLTVHAASPAPFVQNEIADIVQATAELFQERYLDETLGQAMAERLRQRLESGAFDDLTSRTELAAAIQRELRLVQDDKHIQIDFRRTPKDAPSVGTREEQGPPTRAGIREVRLLEGGVGYLRIKSFSEADLQAGLFDAAMRLLAGCDAVIVDLRGNGGGSSRAENELLTSFLGPQPVHIGTTRYRLESRELWTEPRDDQTFVHDAPLFVLIDRETGSAAEAVAYHLKHLGRATIIGERSYGAGNLSATVGLEVWDDADENMIGTYTLVLPRAQTINVKSGRSWDGTGIVPDVATESEKALGEAHVRAIRAAHPSAPWAEKLIASVHAAYEPAELALDELERLAGRYERGRSYRIEQGRLITGDGSGAEMELVPITSTSFRYKSGVSATVHFDLRDDGTVEAARIVFPDGGYERFARVD